MGQRPMPPVNCHYGLWIYSKPKYGLKKVPISFINITPNGDCITLHSHTYTLSHTLSIYLSVCRHILSMDIMTAHCLCVYCILVDRWCSTFPQFCWRRSFSLSVCLHPLCLQSSS